MLFVEKPVSHSSTKIFEEERDDGANLLFRFKGCIFEVSVDDGKFYYKPTFGFRDFWRNHRSNDLIQTVVITNVDQQSVNQAFLVNGLKSPHAIVAPSDLNHGVVMWLPIDSMWISLGVQKLRVDSSTANTHLFGSSDEDLGIALGAANFFRFDPHRQVADSFDDWRHIRFGVR